MDHMDILFTAEEYEQMIEPRMKLGYITSFAVFDLGEKMYAECITDDYEEYRILINSRFTDDRSDIEVKQTIIHEIVHCCKSRFNHGVSFRKAYHKACKIIGISPYPERKTI